jgi:hypothetical protein
MHNRPSSSLPHTGARTPTPVTRRRAVRWWTATLAFGLVALAPAALAGPHKNVCTHDAWVNKFNDPNNIIQGTFSTDSTPELTVTSAGFEVVRGNEWAKVSATLDAK